MPELVRSVLGRPVRRHGHLRDSRRLGPRRRRMRPLAVRGRETSESGRPKGEDNFRPSKGLEIKFGVK